MGATTGTGGPSRRGRGAGAVLHNLGQGHHDGSQGRGEPGARALALLREQPHAVASLVPGLQWLDADVPLDAGTSLGLLGRDAQGGPVLALACDTGELPLARLGAVLSALRRAAPLLQRMHAAQGLDVGRTPQLLLLAPRFPDELPGQLDLLGPLDVSALEYRVVAHPDGSALLDLALLHRTGAGAGAAQSLAGALAGRAPGAPRAAAAGGGAPLAAGPGRPLAAPAARRVAGDAREPDELTAAELEPLAAEFTTGADPDEEPLDAEELFDHLRASIAALSDSIQVADVGPGRVEFRAADALLAELEWAADGATLNVPALAQPHFVVRDEAGLNAALNALFAHFFRQLHGAT